MTGKITNFYAGGNTARGFVSLMDSSLQNVEQTYTLRADSARAKSAVIRVLADRLAEEGHDIWLIHSPFDNDAAAAVIAPGLSLGVLDESAAPADSGTQRRQFITFDGNNGRQTVAPDQADAQKQSIVHKYEQAYAGFAEALRIHDEWEAVYIENMNFAAADEMTREYIQRLYGDRRTARANRIDHRFLGAATPAGAVDFVPNLTEGLERRYFLKGRPGSGKSTMLKQLAKAGIDRGFDVEIYHCGFDPNSLDMVIVRELGFAVFDSTAPHEYFPERDQDVIIDMYQRCIAPGTDEAHAQAISDIRARYSAKMKEAIACLAEAKKLNEALEEQFGAEPDEQAVSRTVDEIWRSSNVTE